MIFDKTVREMYVESNVNIRRARVADIDAIRRINESLGKHFLEKQITHYAHLSYVVTSFDKVCGYAFGSIKEDRGFITHLHMQPKPFSHTMTKKLIEKMVNAFQHTLLIEVFTEDKDLYLPHGFKKWDEDNGTYQMVKENKS
jgi:N-acetylglutamate synthase-like GNAT family acetyltransferase